MNDFTWNKSRYKVFYEIADHPQIQLSVLAETCGLHRAECKRYLQELEDAGFVVVQGKRYSLGNAGYTLIARHNRSEFQTVKSDFSKNHRLGASLSRNARKRIDEIAKLKMKFRKEGLANFDGGRMSIGKGKDLWHPVRWVVIPDPDTAYSLRPLVYEPTTDGDAIKQSVREIRPAFESDSHQFCFLVVCGDSDAAAKWTEMGDDLPMLVAPFADAITGPFRGPTSVWMMDGATIDIDALF